MDDESKLGLENIYVTEDDGADAPSECDSFSNSCTVTPALVANCSSNTVISQELVDSSQRPPSVDRQWGSHIVKVITTVGNSGTQLILTTSSGCTGLNAATVANTNSRIPVKFIVAERISNKIKSPITSPKLSPGTVFKAAQQTVCLSNTLSSANSLKKMTLYPKENLTVIGDPSPKKVALISIPVKQSACHTIVGSQQSVGTSAISSFSTIGESPSKVIELANSPIKIATATQKKIILQPIGLLPVTQNSIRTAHPMVLTQDMPRSGPAPSLVHQLSQSVTASSTFTTAGIVKYVKLLTVPSGESAFRTNGNLSMLKPAVSPLQLVFTAGKALGSSQVVASNSSTPLPSPQVCQVLQTNDWRKSQTNSASQASSRTSHASKRTILPSPFKSTYDQNVSAEELKSAVAHMTKQAALTMRDFQRKTGQRKVQNTMSRSRKTSDFGSRMSICEVPMKSQSRSRVSSSTGSVDGFCGEKSRRPCNCSKSQCLKLYCECFANGEFCSDCNCVSCANNLEHEDDRQKAIKACLDRNPYAFHPKIGKNREGDIGRQHAKGCHCKRSSCLKNYCECFEAKILCTDLCKCFGCKNYELSTVRESLMELADAADTRVQQQLAATNRLHSEIEYSVQKPTVDTNGKRLPHSFMTMDVVEATNSCLLATAEECFVMHLGDAVTERQILEEFGRCLEQVIDAANRSSASEPSDEVKPEGVAEVTAGEGKIRHTVDEETLEPVKN